MTEKISKANLADIHFDKSNANKSSERGRGMIEASMREFGFADAGTLDRNNVIIGGNKRTEVAGEIALSDEAIIIDVDGTKPVYIRRNDLDLSDPEDDRARKLAYALNRTSEVSMTWDTEQLLADMGAGLDLSGMFREDELDAMLAGMMPEPMTDAGAQVDKADELRQKWGVELGQMWQLGEHRLICGDCTDAEVVARVMQGEKAVLCHADPPYGMGKENEGIANDNLYREKLDAFQMAWWHACRPALEDNASAYIWGNAEGLWRLWYCSGLRDSERLTFRNEIVWDKGGGGFGVGTEGLRCYFPEEHCLFFMLGEQGFNNNADNYWEGWEPIRAYLDDERLKMGWNNKFVADLFGFHPRMADHWFNISQWSMPKDEQYKRMQQAARGDAFKRDYDDLKRDYDDLKRDYDDLKRDFYATRAYFDNAHDNMTDVWRFNRVHNEDRYGHATPKPVDMIARVIKSSTPEGGIVYVPFAGTLPEVIACEQLGRKCRAVEISPAYVAVALQRFADSTEKTCVLVD